MKYVKEIVIIFGITMVGELLNKFIPLPVPAGVYGLFILLGGLCSGIIKLSDVEVTGNLLLDLMPVMFIPAAVGIIDKIEELKAAVGVKKTIAEYGVDEKYFLDTLDAMVEQAFDDQCTGANPRYPLMSEIKEMYLRAYYGK